MNGMLSVISSFSSPPVLLALHGFRSDCHLSSNKETTNRVWPHEEATTLAVGQTFYFLHAPCSVATVMPSPHAIISFRPSRDPALLPSLSLCFSYAVSPIPACTDVIFHLMILLYFFFSHENVSEHFLHHVSQQYVIMLHLHTLSHLVVFLIWP